MADKKITDLTALGGTPAGTDIVPMVDNTGTATTKKVTVTNLMAAAPVQTSDLGTAAATAATDYATSAQGTKADSATQPGDLGTAAALDSGTSTGEVVVLDSTGLPAVDGSQLTGVTATDASKLAITSNLSDLNNTATARSNLSLGTAATTAVTDYATSAQGTKADSATQPGDLGTAAALDSGTSTGEVVVLDSTGLPAVDGSQLTGITVADSSKLAITSNLSDLNNTATALSNLGLGTAATTAATDYATSAQGTKADSATQPGDLGTAAALDSGTSTGEVVVLDSTGLPAVDGSQLTGVSASVSPRRWVPDTSTSYTIASSDAGDFHIFTNSSTVTVTVPNTLGAGFTCDIIQGGAGQVQLSAGSGATLYGGTSGTDIYTEGQYCAINLTMDSSGTTGYVTGQIAGPAAFSGITLSNMSGAGYYFDDYNGSIAGGSSASWGSAYFSGSATNLAGKYKKYEIADNATMRSDIQTALSASGWMPTGAGSSYAGYLYAEGASEIENQTTGPMYVFAGSAGTSPTAIIDGGNSLGYIPIIYAIDCNGNNAYGPVWGLTFVYDESGYVEEPYGAQGNYNSNYVPACYYWGSSCSTTQSSFTADGGDGSIPQSASSGMFYGDQA